MPNGGSVASALRRCLPSTRRQGGGRRFPRLPARRLRPGRSTQAYLVRAALSAVALGAAVAAVIALGTMAAPLPEPADSLAPHAVAAVPAALPSVPVPEQRRNPAPVPQRQGAHAPPAGTQPQQAGPQRSFVDWSSKTSTVTGIPARALQAYAHAHAVVAEVQPDCRLTWVTLAGIARIESNHGRYRGRTLDGAGRPSAPIVGVPLDGSPSVRAIGDSDGGALDGDRRWDRAVGPFQFIPTTWARWHSDGDGDGVGDPQDIDDAAVAAARYLCAGNRDLATGDGWLGAVLAYNNSMSYAQQVYSSAAGYARSPLG